MGGSILDQAYDDKRNAALDDELDALVSDYDRRNPPVEPKPTAPTEQTQPEEDADLWTEGPDRPQRISKKAGSSQTASFWGGLKAADDSFRQRQAAGTVTPDTNPNVAFARGLQGTGSDVGKTIEALGPGWQKLWHDAQAFIAENPNGLPRDWQLMSDDQEAYFAEFGGPGFGEGPAGLPGPDMVAPFRSPEEAVAANKAVRKAQLKAAVKEAELRAKLPTSDDPLRQGVIDATFNIGMMVPSLVAGFATRNPYLAVSMMSTQTGVGSYGDARRAGAEPGKAYRYGVTMGAIEGLTEIIPTKLLIGDFVKRTDFIEAFTKQMVADGLGEQAATHLQDLTTWIELNPDKTLDEFLAERPAATIRTAISSAMVSTALTGTTSAINAVTAPKKEGEAAPTPETPPEAAPASPETPAEQSAEAAPAPDGEQAAPTPEQADLLDTVNKVADAVDMAQAEQVPPITPQQESEDQKFVRGVEQALGIKRPAAPVETPEERRARVAERRAAEQRQTEESTARVVEGVRSFAEARNAAEQAVERAVETPAPETIVEAVAAHNELAEQTEAEPISLAEEMGVDTTDRTSSLAEAERMAAELEAMGTEEAAIAAMQFRTLVQYSDRYDDNTFWQGFDEAIENAAPFLMSEEQQQAIVEKVAEAVEDAPLAPEEDASATIVEEVRATAPASRYFGRKSFGGEGLATETPAPEAAPVARTSAKYEVETEDAGSFELTIIRLPDGSVGLIGPDINVNYVPAFAKGKTDQELMAYQFEPLGFKQATDKAGRAAAPPAPAAAPQPARLPPKPAPISETQLAAITTKEGKLSRPVQAREAMLLKAESVYDDILTKEVLEELDDRHDMNVRQVREVMGKAIEGQGSLDRFNTLMKRYAKIRADLDRQAAETPVQADFEALAAAQPDPGDGGLGRGLQSLMAEQGVNPETKFSAGNSRRKPVKDPEKNRKRLDARAYRDWGQNYLDLVQKGLVTYASAEEIAALGIEGATGQENAIFIPIEGSKGFEVVINTSYVKPEQLEGILLHEVGIHGGLKSLMGGERVESVLRSIDRLVESFATKMQQGRAPTRAELAAKSARLRAERNAASPEQVREETLAYIVEDHITNPLMPPFLTQLKVAIGRRFPGIIDRLGWGSAEYAQLALVSLRRFVLKEVRHMPTRYAPGYRSSRAPFLLQVTYPKGFRKLANERGSVKTPQSWARRAMTMGQMQMWRVIRTLDLRSVDTFPQQLKDMERDLTSPEVFDAFFSLDPNFDWENYLDLMYLAQQGDPDAAFDLTEILTKLKGMDVPVEVKFSADGIVNDLPGSALWEASLAKGLDMSVDARRARGTAAGFNMEETLYHGTGSDFAAFDLDRSGDSAGTPGERAIFLSANPTEASVYARNAAVAKNGPGAFGQGANIRGANVMPMVIRPGKQMVVSIESHPDLKSQDGKVMLYNATRFAEIIADARAQGYDTVRFENVLDSALEAADQIAVLNPKDIRSVNAAFDPANAASANVMFSRDIEDAADLPDVDPALEEVYFNFLRFGDPDTVHPTIREALKSAGVKERMGPPMTLRETEIEAQNTNAFEAMVKSRKGETLTFAELTALRNMHKYSALKLKELADMANADPSDKSLEAAVMRASMFHTALLAEIKGQSAQAARTLNAMKIQAKATAAIATAVDNMLGEANTTGDLRRMIRDLAQMDASKIANLNKRVEMSTWKAWQDLAGTWLRAMYLSMPSTHIVNALGNITTMLGSIADHHVAGRITFDPDLVEESRVRFDAMIEAFVHQFTYMKANSQLNPLKPNTSVNFDAEGVSGVNRWEGQDRAMSAARLEKLSRGLLKATPDDPVGKLAEIVGYALAAPSEALGTADDLFKGANYRISLRGQSFRKAREERRAGKITEEQEQARAEELFQWPSEEMVKTAIAEAQENTFTRPVGPMTKTAMSVRQWLNSGTGALGYLLMPFILTPSNIMSFRFRRMPTAPLFQEWRDSFNKGGKDRAVAIAQVTNGTTLLMAGGALFAAGLMTGSGPDDPNKRKALMDTGWKPFAMRLPDGSYMETNRLDPVMMPLHISALIAEVFANNGWNTDPSDDIFELVSMSALKFGQMMTDKTYMAGLANLFESFGKATNSRPLESWVNRTVAGATTPALLAGVRRADDPFKRQAFSIIDQIRNRVPVLSEGLPIAYDVFGHEVMYQEGFMAPFQLVNPFAVSKGKDEPIYAEIQRLKYIPEPMDWTITVPFAGNSVAVSLRDRPDIYSDMTRMFGGDEEYGLPNFRQVLNDFVQDEGYQELSDINDPAIKGSKAQAISEVISRARREIKGTTEKPGPILIKYWPDLQDMARKEFAAQVKLGQQKEAEDQASAVTEAYQQLLEQAK